MEYAQRVHDGEFDTAWEAVNKENLPVDRQRIEYYLDKLRKESGQISQRAQAQAEIGEVRANAMNLAAAAEGDTSQSLEEGAGLEDETASMAPACQANEADRDSDLHAA